MEWTPAATVLVISAGSIVYSYVLYPFLLRLVPTRRRNLSSAPVAPPSISIVLSVFNEEKHVARRIENLLSVDYPSDQMEILIGSDGSTDGTDQIARGFRDPRVKFHAFSPRCGKTSVIRRLVAGAQGRILVFTDAAAIFAPDALRKLMRNFDDPRIGGVGGEIVFVEGSGSKTDEGAYWKLETYLRRREGSIDSCLGATGAIYAIRRELWPEIPDNTLIDDFVIPMRVREQGFRFVYEAEAIATEKSTPSVGQEMTRRIRIGAGGFQSLCLCWRSLLPWRGFHAFAFWSHKVLRWLGPFCMIAALVANGMLLTQPVFRWTLALQLGFYVLAMLGAMVRRRKIALFTIPLYFVSMNMALALGFFRFVTGTQSAAWKRTIR